MVTLQAETSTQTIQKTFESHKAHQYALAKTTATQRIKKLHNLLKSISRNKQAIRDAMYKDYRKPAAEVDLTEIFIVTSEIKHATSHLRQWMRPQKVATPLALLGSSSWIQPEPKGTSLIISPWNYPFNLSFGPLVSAVAAGNTVILKPSEFSPNINGVIKKIISEVFPEKEVSVIEGAIETATALLDLPFNHIFFTGAPAVGKIVMAAAAKHLTSVTLELGGKSPTIIDETANINDAVNRITWGKFSNNGQICLAPDYVFVHESKAADFVNKMRKKIEALYGKDPSASGSDYMRVINSRHLGRVQSYLDNSVKAGAKIAHGGNIKPAENYFEPTLVTDVPLDSDLMQKEIFGPVLPILTYTDIDNVLQHIRAGEKPLAVYIYSKSRKMMQRIIEGTRAGTTAINHNNVHFSNTNLPFGGSNSSGIGKGHGKYAFDAFSNLRGIYKQNLPSATDMLMPPYNGLKQKIIDFTLRWL